MGWRYAIVSKRTFVRSVGAELRQIAGLLPQGGPGPVLAVIVCNVLLGALPVLFVVGTSVMLGLIPAAAEAGTGSAQWSAVVLAFVLASVAFTAHQALAPAQRTLGDHLARRIDGRLFDRIITASLRGSGLAALENQHLIERLGEAKQDLELGMDSPGRACAGALHLISRGVQLLGYLLVIGIGFSWTAGVGVVAAVLMFRYGLRSGLRKYSESWERLTKERREARYLRQLAMGAAAGKEIRTFGLVEWLRDRHRAVYLRWLAPTWAERRRLLLWPYLRYTALGLGITMGVLVAVASAGAGGASLTSLALVTQAVLNCLRLGEFYPESDMQTLHGMRAYRALTEFEQGAEALRRAREPVAAGGTAGSGAADPTPRQEIRFSHVSFRYPGGKHQVFDELDLSIPAGMCTAIVGSNGAGKTTLIKLLTRLYEPDEGTITIDGVDLASFPLDAWRSRTAVVFQDFNRYETSAADNIGFGDVRHGDVAGDRDEIRGAAKDAGILDTIEVLPDGLDTPLAKHMARGVDLSGGQWQRLALARALFRLRHNGGVLVLDEPTASLDARAEARFFEEFVRPANGATTLLISHRFSTVRHADHIVVLSDGRVTEAGSHDELVRADGKYARMFRLQAARFTTATSSSTDESEGHG